MAKFHNQLATSNLEVSVAKVSEEPVLAVANDHPPPHAVFVGNLGGQERLSSTKLYARTSEPETIQFEQKRSSSVTRIINYPIVVHCCTL